MINQYAMGIKAFFFDSTGHLPRNYLEWILQCGMSHRLHLQVSGKSDFLPFVGQLLEVLCPRFDSLERNSCKKES